LGAPKVKIMSNALIIDQICKALNLDNEKTIQIEHLYLMDSDRFDKNPNDVLELFMTFMGPSKGLVCFKIYQSKLGLKPRPSEIEP